MINAGADVVDADDISAQRLYESCVDFALRCVSQWIEIVNISQGVGNAFAVLASVLCGNSGTTSGMPFTKN